MATKTITTCDVCGKDITHCYEGRPGGPLQHWKLSRHAKRDLSIVEAEWDVCMACMARIRSACRAEEEDGTYIGPAIHTGTTGRSA